MLQRDGFERKNERVKIRGNLCLKGKINAEGTKIKAKRECEG